MLDCIQLFRDTLSYKSIRAHWTMRRGILTNSGSRLLLDWRTRCFRVIDGQPCNGQMVLVKTRYPLTSTKWPCHRIIFLRETLWTSIKQCLTDDTHNSNQPCHTLSWDNLCKNLTVIGIFLVLVKERYTPRSLLRPCLSLSVVTESFPVKQ